MSAAQNILIDGDLILYRGCVAVEREVRWDEENHVLFGNEAEAWKNVSGDLNRLFDRFGTNKHVLALSEGPIFRLAISDTYKSNRAGQRKPTCFTAVRERLEREFNVVKLKGLEADDVLGIFGSRDPDGSVVCTEDKDLKSVPCTLFQKGEVTRVDALSADYWHLYQTLVGDTTDGYPGCPGVGPVKAKKIIQDAIDAEAHLSGNMTACVWPAIVAAFEKAGLTEADALKQARLARILRDVDWDAEKKEPILWTP